jgi:hypothetical protein
VAAQQQKRNSKTGTWRWHIGVRLAFDEDVGRELYCSSRRILLAPHRVLPAEIRSVGLSICA